MCGGLLRVDSVDYSMPSISTVDGSFLRIKDLFSVAETRRLLSRALVVRWTLRVNKRWNRALCLPCHCLSVHSMDMVCRFFEQFRFLNAVTGFA